jgi:hypothetical protein
MKKYHFILYVILLVAISLISSCSKDNGDITDTRDQFAGTWTGTKSYTFTDYPTFNKTVSDTVTISLIEGSSTDISVESSGYSETAKVNGNKFTYNQYAINITLGSNPYTLTIKGSVTISGKKLTGSGTFSATSGKGTSTGTWTNSLTKQDSDHKK